MYTHINIDLPKLLIEQTEQGKFYIGENGERYPSVTTMLRDHNKEGIDQWRKRVGDKAADRICKQTSDRGTLVHTAIESLLKNEPVTPIAMPNIKSVYLRMKEELKKVNNIHALETPLISHEMKLGGQVDCIAEYNGVLSVVDFKTSTRLKKKEWVKNYFIQIAAYARMFHEMTGLEINQGVILIGVETAGFCQTFKFNVQDHYGELDDAIAKYRDARLVA